MRPGISGSPGHPTLPACPCSSFCTFPAPRCGASGFNHLLPYATLRLSMLNFTCRWGPLLCFPVSAALQTLHTSVPPGSDISLRPTPTAGLILRPSAGRSSPGRPRSRAAGAALHQLSSPELCGETRRWSRPCSRGAGEPPAATPCPSPDLCLTLSCVLVSNSAKFILFQPFGWDFDFWKPGRLCGASCAALVRCGSVQTAGVLGSRACAGDHRHGFCERFTPLAAPFYVPSSSRFVFVLHAVPFQSDVLPSSLR